MRFGETVSNSCFSIHTNTGFAYGGFTEVGCKNLNGNVGPLGSLNLKQNHGDGIRLFASCTCRHPYPQRLPWFFPFEQFWKQIFFQILVRIGVAEKTRDIDEQILVENIDLFVFLGKQFCIILECADFIQQHSANDAPLDSVHLIRPEINPGESYVID